MFLTQSKLYVFMSVGLSNFKPSIMITPVKKNAALNNIMVIDNLIKTPTTVLYSCINIKGLFSQKGQQKDEHKKLKVSIFPPLLWT